MRKLVEIDDFGNIDANLDDLLEDCFAEHYSFNEIKDFKKFLVIGKKGSGKTAVFKKLLKTNTYDTFCEGHNLHDYPWHFHAVQAKTGVPENEKYIQSWKYFLLITISKILLNKDQNIPYDEDSRDSISNLEKFVVDTYGSKNPDITNIFNPVKKIRFRALFEGKLGNKEIKLQLPFETIEMKDLPTVVQDVNRTLLNHVMKCLHPKHNYYVCFDELDMSFEKDSKEYFNQIIGLIRAAREFNIEATKKCNKKLNICIFLRDDIYDLLKFEDKRKITQNFVTRIEWDTDRTDTTLRNLMEKRFSMLLSENGVEGVTWNEVFDENTFINGKMSKYNYIIDMTCLRPRDMIDFCNNILIEYKKRVKDQSKFENIFINEDITKAKVQYSRNLLEEFDDEVHKHIPEYETYLNIIQRVGKSKFMLSEFNRVYEQMKKKLADQIDPLMILDKLYEFSIIGNYKIGGKQGGSEKIFKYKRPKNTFDEDLKIIVHLGLANMLGLKEK